MSRAQLVAMVDAVAVRGEPRVVGELGQAERLAEPRPLPLGADRHGELAIGGGERLVRDDVRVGVAAPAGRPPRDERVLGLVDEDRKRRPEQRHVDPLAGAAHGAISAARIPIAAYSPVTTSLIATPTLVGRPPSASASPVIDIRPPTAWMTKS